MSEFTTPFNEIAPFAQPANWDGNRIGQDPLQAQPRAYIPLLRFKDSTDRLTDYLSVTAGFTPLRSYRAGDEFDANDHDHGAIFGYNMEMLESRRPFPAVDESQYAKPPTYEPVDYTIGKERDKVVSMQYEDMLYSRFMWWGIVAKTMRGNTLLSIPGVTLQRHPDGRVRPGAAFEAAGSQFVVGKPFGNRRLQRGDAHSYNRISALDQMAYGTSKRSPILNRMLGRFGRLAAE